jgi:hypothetical protein
MRYSFVTTLAAVLVTTGSAQAQVPFTVSDIARCNHEATAKAGTPGALPESRPRAPDTAQMLDAREGVPASSGGQKSDPSGAIIMQSPDPLLLGMDAERASDPAYRAAYRECMAQRAPR